VELPKVSDGLTGTATVEAVHLTKRYGGRTALEDVSFAAHSGDIVGLLGPNGAGKTTTIRVLTTVLTPTSGEFRIAAGQVLRRRRSGKLSECFRKAAATPASQPAGSSCVITRASTA
jgi:ABC-type branched-subunit amino acid transport system ATPase component